MDSGISISSVTKELLQKTFLDLCKVAGSWGKSVKSRQEEFDRTREQWEAACEARDRMGRDLERLGISCTAPVEAEAA